jgi:hypothetical protein
MALMISICYSKERSQFYFWLYHLFGWLTPVCTTLAIYFQARAEHSKDEPIKGLPIFETIQLTASTVLLAVCITIITINLLRIARRRYRLKYDKDGNRRVSFTSNESLPLIDEDNDRSQILIHSNSTG